MNCHIQGRSPSSRHEVASGGLARSDIICMHLCSNDTTQGKKCINNLEKPVLVLTLLPVMHYIQDSLECMAHTIYRIALNTWPTLYTG